MAGYIKVLCADPERYPGTHTNMIRSPAGQPVGFFFFFAEKWGLGLLKRAAESEVRSVVGETAKLRISAWANGRPLDA